MTVGIYRLYWGGERNYIGQSVNVEQRIKTHLRKLSNGSHANTDMQSVYKYYGEPRTSILAEVPEGELNAAEAYYVSLFDSYNNGLNKTKGGGTRTGGPMFSWNPVSVPDTPEYTEEIARRVAIIKARRQEPDHWVTELLFNKWTFSAIVVAIYIIFFQK